MGRYAQAQRRGGGPPAGPSLAGGAVILSVATSGSTATLTFNAPIVVNAGVFSDSQFTVNGQAPNFAAVAGANQIFLAFPLPVSAAVPWALTGPRPAWTSTTLFAPAAGVTS